MQDSNPYRPPQAKLSDPLPSYAPLPPARAVPMANALLWFQSGLQLVLRSPGRWLGLGALYFALLMALDFVPVVGPAIRNVLAVIIEAGLLLACRRAETNPPELSDLLAGFQQASRPLLVLGAIALITLLAAAVAATILEGETGWRRVVFGEYPAFEQGAAVQDAAVAPDLGTLMLINIASMLAGLPLVFASALIVFHGPSAITAVKLSARAMLLNLPALLTASAINVVLIGFALVSFGLLLIPLVPWMIATAYMAYKDVFRAPTPAAPVASN